MRKFIISFVLFVLGLLSTVPALAQVQFSVIPCEPNEEILSVIRPYQRWTVTPGDANSFRSAPITFQENRLPQDPYLKPGVPFLVLSQPFCVDQNHFAWVAVVTQEGNFGFTAVGDLEDFEPWIEPKKLEPDMVIEFSTALYSTLATQIATISTDTPVPSSTSNPAPQTSARQDVIMFGSADCTPLTLTSNQAVVIGRVGPWTPQKGDIDGNDQILRSSPTVDDTVALTYAPVGSVVTILPDSPICATGHLWYKVQIGSYTGWLSGKNTTDGQIYLTSI